MNDTQTNLFDQPSRNQTLSSSPHKIEDRSWKQLLAEEFESEYFTELKSFVKSERALGKTIYPDDHDIFNALKFAPFPKVKVVVLGQDPYHGPNQAHGLCFSVRPGIKPPPSLVNVYKELNSDLGTPIPQHGYLEKWARQGVLLLNAVLTVEASKPASHQGKGWERFTDQVVSILNEQTEGLVFLLWGAHAQRKGEIINPTKHHILKAPHPSPFSANRGFFGCKHFSETNRILRDSGRAEIDWSLN